MSQQPDPDPTPPPRQVTYIEPTTVGLRRYRAIYVPEGCTTYEEQGTYEMYVVEPAPPYIILSVEGPCDGVILSLLN